MQPNASAKELEKFAKHAQDWWNPQGSLRTLHHINPLRLAFVKDYLHHQPSSILDMGCGGGIFAEGLAKMGHEVTGIDLGCEAIAVASAHHTLANLQYHCVSVEDWCAEHKESYDVITAMEMLEHIPNPQAIITSAAAALKQEGFLILSTINRTWQSLLGHIGAAEYLLHLVPRGTHTFDQFITPNQISAWASEAKLDLIAIKGMAYNPFTHSAKLVNNPKGSYLVVLQKRSI